MIGETGAILQMTGTVPTALNTNNNVSNNESKDFKHVLAEALHKVNDQQLQAEQLHKQLAAGEVDHLHQVTVAAEKAALSLQLALQVRNKVVEAYSEVMRMQI